MFVVLAGLGGLTAPTKMRVVVGLAGILGGVNPPQHSPRHIILHATLDHGTPERHNAVNFGASD